MINDLELYKYRFVTFVLLLGYAFLHMQLTGFYSELSLPDLVNFSVRLPFGQRLLVPALVHLIAPVLPFELEQLFFLMEWLFVSLFYFALVSLFSQEFKPRQAQFLSWLFIILLPLITVINYRLQRSGTATFFYPYDTATLFFMAVGYSFCLRAQWLYFIPWVFLATLNRESAILLVLMVPALHWQQLKTVIKPTLFAFLAFLLARVFILLFLTKIPGDLWEWRLYNGQGTLFTDNLSWLINEQNLLLFIFCFAAIPLFWFAFYNYIPIRYRPLKYIALAYFLGLTIVGRFMEARIFSEIVLMLYLPVSMALKSWLLEQKPISPNQSGLAYYFDRYAVLGFLIVIVLLVKPLNSFLMAIL